MSKCEGFKHDVLSIKRKKLVSWSKNSRHYLSMMIVDAKDIYPGNFNWSFEGIDDNYPTKINIIHSEEDLQNSMLEWVRNNS